MRHSPVFRCQWSFGNHSNMRLIIICAQSLIIVLIVNVKTFKVHYISQNSLNRNEWFIWMVIWFPQNCEAAQLISKLIIIRNVSLALISILEWFLKDHMTLKTLVMMLKTQLCITGINYIHIVKRYFKFKSYFTILLIYWINYWSNKCSLGDRQSESVQKH